MLNVAITLIGAGGAGKSTVAALVGERLGITFVDLDRRHGLLVRLCQIRS
jgi:shikimate kinase